jgi:predicted N-formylglutamate amidohydrolase
MSPIAANCQATPCIAMARCKGLPHALLEVRQDLIHDDAGVDEWARTADTHADKAC